MHLTYRQVTDDDLKIGVQNCSAVFGKTLDRWTVIWRYSHLINHEISSSVEIIDLGRAN